MGRMKTKRDVNAWLLAVVIRIIFALLQMFPIEWNLQTARLLARLWIWLSPRHRDRALAHLQASFGDAFTPVQLKRLAERCLASWTMFAVEVACMPRLINRFTWSRYIRLVNCEELIELIVGGRGLILVTGHYGSFELIGHFLASLGLPIAAVMRPFDNVYLNEYLVSTRRTHGLRLLDKKGAMTEAEEILESGAMLAFIGDQDAGRKGIFVEFFDRPASTYKSIGLLAMATGRPIVVGSARRRGIQAQYDFMVERIIHPDDWADKPDPLRWITQSYTAGIEQFVRQAPEQYLWIHRRWKSRPDGAGRRPSREVLPSPAAARG